MKEFPESSGEIGVLDFPIDLGQSKSLARVYADTYFYGLVYVIKLNKHKHATGCSSYSQVVL